MRRPRRVPEPLALVARCELEQRLELVMALVDRCRGVAALAQSRRNALHGELGRGHIRALVPLQRAGNARVGDRADRIRRGDRAVARVLVVVDEDALAFLLPPAAPRPARPPPPPPPGERPRPRAP